MASVNFFPHYLYLFYDGFSALRQFSLVSVECMGMDRKDLHTVQDFFHFKWFFFFQSVFGKHAKLSCSHNT